MGASRIWMGLCLGAMSCAWVTDDEYLAAWDADSDGFSLQTDCAKTDGDIYPGAPDFRGDGCDADCGLAPDLDGDDWPNDADCNPADPTVFPCNPNEAPDDGKDSDCDGKDTARTDQCNPNDPSHPGVDAPELSADCANPAVAAGS
jgi:hypothetical protein